eukprot:9159465-Alexandrium_andersonii.AAC.1
MDADGPKREKPRNGATGPRCTCSATGNGGPQAAKPRRGQTRRELSESKAVPLGFAQKHGPTASCPLSLRPFTAVGAQHIR